MRIRALILAPILAASATADDTSWSTYRGNARRTGNTDNVAGPATPAVLWSVQSREHYAASPVPAGSDVLFPALGSFNDGVVHSFPMAPKDPKAVKPTWSKGPPFVKLPTVSSPALADGKIVFGAGMHQSDGAALYCFPADGGHLLWMVSMAGPSARSGRTRSDPEASSPM